MDRDLDYYRLYKKYKGKYKGRGGMFSLSRFTNEKIPRELLDLFMHDISEIETTTGYDNFLVKFKKKTQLIEETTVSGLSNKVLGSSGRLTTKEKQKAQLQLLALNKAQHEEAANVSKRNLYQYYNTKIIPFLDEVNRVVTNKTDSQISDVDILRPVVKQFVDIPQGREAEMLGVVYRLAIATGIYADREQMSKLPSPGSQRDLLQGELLEGLKSKSWPRRNHILG